MSYVIWLFLGTILGTGLIIYARQHGVKGEKRILCIALVIAAALYVGFAITWGDMEWVLIELAGIPAYGLFIWLAVRHSFIWLAIGWGLHPAWDIILHLYGSGHTFTPEWYAVACITFDLLVAGYIVTRTVGVKAAYG